MRVGFVFSAAMALSFVCPAWAQFPDLPGRDGALKACGGCHEPERASSLRQDQDGWDTTMSAMASRGMMLSDTEYNAVLAYLVKAFPAAPPKPVNINTAEAIDMETAFSLLRSQAAAIVAYREKHGKFKTLDDLKKVPGLDFAKLEAKKERIAF